MIGELPPNVIFKVIKPLYGIPEAGTHWFGTYYKHHREKLGMGTSTYDPCLLITKDGNGPFWLVGMQTDDTLILGDNEIVKQEDVELKRAELLAKPSEELTGDNPLLCNGCKLMMDEVVLVQKEQGKRLGLIDPNSDEAEVKQAFLEQRARGAYIGTIFQPEAAFDLSVAALERRKSRLSIGVCNGKWIISTVDFTSFRWI